MIFHEHCLSNLYTQILSHRHLHKMSSSRIIDLLKDHLFLKSHELRSICDRKWPVALLRVCPILTVPCRLHLRMDFFLASLLFVTVYVCPCPLLQLQVVILNH